jgi:hypothetical protein
MEQIRSQNTIIQRTSLPQIPTDLRGNMHTSTRIKNMDKPLIHTHILYNKVTLYIPLSQSKDCSVKVKLELRGDI